MKTVQVNSIMAVSILFSFSLFIQIDFNISLEESGIVVQSSGAEGVVARGKEALTILDNPETRNTFIDELMEVWRKCSVHVLLWVPNVHMCVLQIVCLSIWIISFGSLSTSTKEMHVLPHFTAVFSVILRKYCTLWVFGYTWSSKSHEVHIWNIVILLSFLYVLQE